MRQVNSQLKTWLGITITTFLMLIIICTGIPAILIILRVPSFEIGEGVFWILRWQNNAAGSGISFNLLALLIIACLVGLLGLFLRRNR